MTPKIAVILFPGTNCEIEALRALKRSDMQPELIRWNDTETDYASFDGFFIPGGFSYEDRGRSGIIASKNPLLEKVKQEADKGKPVLGVCNGAQIVLEAKLIPGLDPEHVDMALAFNKRITKEGKVLASYFNEWVNIKNVAKKERSAFNNYDQDLIQRYPIAHNEGRFTTIDKELLDILEKNDQLVFKYCDKNGEVKDEYPINPNGAVLNTAGICNPEGNVLSLMPHPERTPKAQAIFDSMASYVNGDFKIQIPENTVKERTSPIEDKVKKYENPDIEVFVDTVITDNEERTIEYAIHEMGFKDLELKKLLYYGIETSNENKVGIAEQLLKTGEIVNMAKEIPTVKIDDKYYSFDPTDGLKEIYGVEFKDEQAVLAFDKDDIIGEGKLQTIRNHFSINDVEKISRGKKWKMKADEETANKVVASHIFHNPHSMNIYKA